jgi:hypothetical protein
VHSLAYSGFFEDPITWLVLGIAAAALVTPRPAQPPLTELRRPREPVPAR